MPARSHPWCTPSRCSSWPTTPRCDAARTWTSRATWRNRSRWNEPRRGPLLVLGNEDVDRLIDMKDCIEALAPMYRDFEQGRALLSPRVDNMAPTSAEGAYYAFKHMGGTWPARGI